LAIHSIAPCVVWQIFDIVDKCFATFAYQQLQIEDMPSDSGGMDLGGARIRGGKS